MKTDKTQRLEKDTLTALNLYKYINRESVVTY